MNQSMEEEILFYLLERAPLLFFVVDNRGRIVQANGYAETVTGFQLRGTPLADLIVDFSGTFDPGNLARESHKEHLLNIKARGLPQSYYFTFTEVQDQVLVFGRSDTEEIESTRRKVQSLNEDLNNLTRKLHKTNAQLEQLNRLKDQFLGMATHDLRKPVSAIVHYTEFLLDEATEALTSEHVGFLQTIHSSTALMRRVIDDFLDISLIESGRFHVNLDATSMEEPMNRSLELHRPVAKKHGVALRVSQLKPLPVILMDDFKVEQVFNNLISNAIEHSPTGGQVVIDLSLTGEGVTVAVKNTGDTIPIPELEKLFEPFERGQNRKARGIRSTGLGLSISKKIIEAHHGRIWAENPEEGGAAFCFTLPLDPQRGLRSE